MLVKSVRQVLVPAICLLVLTFTVACGGGSSTTTSQNQTCSACLFAYASTASGGLLTYRVSNTSGQLSPPTSISGPVNSAGLAAIGVIGFAKVFLYASDPQNNSIRVLAVNTTDGTLSAASVGPFLMDSNGEPGAMAVFNSFLYVVSSSGSISAFSADQEGALTTVPGSPFASGSGLSQLLVFAGGSGNYLYASNSSDANGGISAFSIGANGALTAVSGSPFGSVPNGGPAGLFATDTNHLYVALKNAGAVAAFTVGANGALTTVAGSPFLAGHGTASVTGTNDFVLATNSLDGTISSFTQDSGSGALTQVVGSPFTGAPTSGNSVSTGHGEILVPNGVDNNIGGFTFDITDGAVTAVPGSPFVAAGGPVSLTSFWFPPNP